MHTSLRYGVQNAITSSKIVIMQIFKYRYTYRHLYMPTGSFLVDPHNTDMPNSQVHRNMLPSAVMLR